MPKKNKKQKNKKNIHSVQKRPLILKDMYQEYGRVIKILGGRNFTCECYDGITRMCTIRKSRRFQKVKLDSIVLLSLRDFQIEKADILLVYDRDEINQLIEKMEIPNVITKSNDNIEFDYNYEDEPTTLQINVDAI